MNNQKETKISDYYALCDVFGWKVSEAGLLGFIKTMDVRKLWMIRK